MIVKREYEVERIVKRLIKDLLFDGSIINSFDRPRTSDDKG